MKELGEVYTPHKVIEEFFEEFEFDFKDENKRWLEPSCGDGRFLLFTKNKLLKEGIEEKHIVEKMLFGSPIGNSFLGL